MPSMFDGIVNAVLEGKAVLVPSDGISKSSLRVAIWRELKLLKKAESKLGIASSLGEKEISITQEDEEHYRVKLDFPKVKTVPFVIIEDDKEVD